MDTRDPLLPRIKKFIDRKGMKPTTFGKAALGDPTLVFEMEKGRELRKATAARVIQFMREYRKPEARA
jgi:predicted transcriptional regulator